MEEADKLRRQAKRALQLAEEISDQYSTKALKTLAATLFGQAESLDQGVQTVLSDQQPQQQQQGQPPGRRLVGSAQKPSPMINSIQISWTDSAILRG
jgi:hypothetical protein